MEPATVETLETAQDLAKIIISHASKSTKRDKKTGIPVPPLIHPLGQPGPNPGGECFAPLPAQLPDPPYCAGTCNQQ